jgi:hypothetical protein
MTALGSADNLRAATARAKEERVTMSVPVLQVTSWPCPHNDVFRCRLGPIIAGLLVAYSQVARKSVKGGFCGIVSPVDRVALQLVSARPS